MARRKKSFKKKAKSMLPKTAPKLLAMGTLAYNVLNISRGNGNPLNALMSGNFTSAGQGILSNLMAPETYDDPVIYAGAGYMARKALGPGPTIVGSFRAW